MAKSLGPFDVRRVPESQKHAKTKEICFAVLKPNEKVLFRKSSESMAIKSRSL
jgi:hypothetical protein